MALNEAIIIYYMIDYKYGEDSGELGIRKRIIS
jgi:hypothetical protein